MNNKFPTGLSFQRLGSFPLDNTCIIDTLQEAKDYAANNPTAYQGQIICVKDARSDEEINSENKSYMNFFYIDYYKNLRSLCIFSYYPIVALINIMDSIKKDKDATSYIDELKALIYDNYTHDFSEYPNN
jgi:hypothetical protein